MVSAFPQKARLQNCSEHAQQYKTPDQLLIGHFGVA